MSSALLLLALATGCDRNALQMDLIPEPGDVPGLVEIGEWPAMPQADWWDYHTRMSGSYYGVVGAPEPGEKGGAVLTFAGTGGNVCIVLDPEAVSWSTSVAVNPTSAGDPWRYPDNFDDDGDLDLSVGLSANYTGSPGLEIGDFKGQYTDELGNVVNIEYDLCETVGRWGSQPAHSGRATVEYCSVDTYGREGISYTVVLRTFSLPIDDGELNFAVSVVDVGADDCSVLAEWDPVTAETRINECSLPVESPEPGFEELEYAYCDGTLVEFCSANPELCGDL